MNDLNLRFERTPSSRHMTYLKEQKQRRDADEGILFAEGECMDNYYATRLSDWMNKKPGTVESGVKYESPYHRLISVTA